MEIENKRNFWLGILGLIGAGIFFVVTKDPTAANIVNKFNVGNTLILTFISFYFIRDGIGDGWRS